MHPHLRLRVERVAKGLKAFGHLMHEKSARRIDHIDTVRSMGLHQFRMPRQLGRRRHVRHHEEARHVHAELARVLHMLAGHIGLGRMRRDANRARARLIGAAQILHRADTGNQQRRHDGALHVFRHSRNPFEIGVGAESIVEAGPRQPIAVGNLNGVDSRRVAGQIASNCTCCLRR